MKQALTTLVVLALIVAGAWLLDQRSRPLRDAPPPAIAENPSPLASAQKAEPSPVQRPDPKITAPAAEGGIDATMRPAEGSRSPTETRGASVEPRSLTRAPASEGEEHSPPSFDVVRVTPRGETVIAGRAKPGSRVVVRDGETVIGEAVANRRGEFVVVPAQILKPGTRRLGLEAEYGDSKPVLSEHVVVVLVPEPGRGEAGAPAEAVATPLAVQIARSGEGPATVLQKPAAREEPLALAVDAVDVTPDGRLAVGGWSSAGAQVLVYLDNVLIGRAEADSDGRWRLSPVQPAPAATSTLRADQVAADGSVIARVEIPVALSAAGAPVADRPGAVTIIRGHTLWHIARRTYGHGIHYTVIHESNREHIRDPDLIYPGQVFTLPMAPESSG